MEEYLKAVGERLWMAWLRFKRNYPIMETHRESLAKRLLEDLWKKKANKIIQEEKRKRGMYE